MDGNRKRFSLGWYTGVLVGVTFSGAVVYAVTLPNTFTDGSTASAQQVNDNFTALRNAVNGNGPCTAANASDEMVRVGSVCVDKNPAGFFTSAAADGAAVTDANFPAGCNANGTGCSGIFAQSRANAGGAITTGAKLSWARAATACANAGKRLATPTEIITGANLGAIVVSPGNNIFVNAALPPQTVGDVMRAAFVEFNNDDFALFGEGTSANSGTPYTETFAAPIVTFRCAR